MSQSADTNWWLNSGGVFYGNATGGTTGQGEFPPGSKWQVRYAARNPQDSDGGSHPQNVFRLVRRQILADPHQEMTVRLVRIHPSGSPNRNDSNGIFLLSHYLSGDRVYSAGLRVDGAAVVKKSQGRRFFTLAYRKLYPGRYDRERVQNLIPENRDITLATDVVTSPDGSVDIDLYVDGSLVLEAVDRGGGGDAPITQPGYVGIATDFMDAEFRGYEARETG